MTAEDGAALRAAARPARRSLVAGTLRRVAVRIALVVALATLASFLHVRASLEEQAVEQLTSFVAERRDRESIAFDLASERLAAFGAALGFAAPASPSAASEARFAAIFVARDDGTIRLRPEIFDRYGVSGLIGKSTELTSELRARLVAMVDALVTHGPSWASRFRNLFVVTPENAVLMYWPGRAWALQASDWEVYGKLELALGRPGEVVVLGERDAPANLGTAWSEPYFDYGAREWVISATRPVAVQGRLVATVGHDILLNELFERTLAPALEGTTTIIVSADGRLIAHPRYMQAIRAQSRALALEAVRDEQLSRTFALVREAPPGTIVRNTADAEFIASTQLSGPGWYLLTVFPERIVERRAAGTAQWILVAGLAALLAELAILFVALRRQVAQPLRELVAATGDVAAGRFDTRLPDDRDDELGHLAGSFRSMMHEVALRETALSERNDELAALNAQLSAELEERKRVQLELERQRELRALLDTIDYGVLITGPDGRVRMHNRAYRELTGMPEALLAQRPTLNELAEFAMSSGILGISADQRDAYRRELADLVRRAPAEAVEWQLASGRILRRQITALPDGGRLLTYFDLSALKRTEAALMAARDEALRANRAKSAFLANVSHEFRTPLNAITGYSELMIEELLEAGAPDLVPDLQRIRDAGNQLLTLINDILDLSKIEAGHIDVRLTVFDLEPILRACLALVRPTVRAGAVALCLEAEPDLPLVSSDPDRVRQILVNLLSNAAKFTDAGRITLRAVSEPSYLRVEVADTGLGIEPAAHEAIFEEFRQVASGPGTGRQGTGLGLAIARRLARLLGGDITVTSELGRGSTFTLTIPRAGLDTDGGAATAAKAETNPS